MSAAPRARPLLTLHVLARREWVRFLRQPARVAAAIGTPALMWLFLASGFADVIQPESLGDLPYSVFLLPGMLTLVAMFAAIFGSISLIEQRSEGWLSALIVMPLPRWSIACGKIAGGASVAFAQSVVLLLAVPLLDVTITLPGALQMMLVLALVCIGVTALGLAFAWRCESSAGFHSVMNLVFMPLWLLSGAFFPASGGGWLARLMQINPLTWANNTLRAGIDGQFDVLGTVAVGLFAGVCVVAAAWVMSSARPIVR